MNLHECAKASISNTFKKTENPVHLLLDEESVKLISVLFSRSELLERFQIVSYQVVEDSIKESVKTNITMDCIAFLRPAPSNIVFLEKEISKRRRFASYQVHFTNILDSTALDRLARADAYEKISDLTQVYCDHYVIHSSLFVTNPHANHRTPRYGLAYVVFDFTDSFSNHFTHSFSNIRHFQTFDIMNNPTDTNSAVFKVSCPL